ncbi:MAG: hypothetical protein BWK79_08215 [Beggiatoa sp. IS2]|nr:MAG: hypothetical protein BWK79_08215 [Beggiatoa sp. IS2]
MEEQVLKNLTTLTGLSAQDFAILREYAPKIQPWGEKFAKAFYDTLFAYELTAAVFKEGERATREITLREWYLEVTSGELTEDFWQRQWTVGLIHISKKVTNPLMLGMMSRVQQLFLQECLQAFEPAQAEQVYLAFKRVTDVIAGVITEGYFFSYVEAMSNVGGLKLSLVERMIDLEINKKLAKLRKKPQ